MNDTPKNSTAKVWYSGEHRDTMLYLLVAVLIIEMVVGGVSLFYGLIHSIPDPNGGPGSPRIAQFPWLAWAVASVTAPVAFLLVVHLAGRFIFRTMEREERDYGDGQEHGETPEKMRRFYAIVRSAPTVVLLLGILLLGAAIFFIDGITGELLRLVHTLASSLGTHLPWVVGSFAGLILLLYLLNRFFAFRQAKLEHEYAFRREIFEKTGLVLVDKGTVPLSQNPEQNLAIAQADNKALPPVLDVETGGNNDLPSGK